MSNEGKKDWWDKFHILTNAFAVVGVVIVGWWIDSTLKRRETSAKMVEVAVGVLKSKPDESSSNLRTWAIQVVNKYSEVPLPIQAQEELKTNALPVRTVLTDAAGNVMMDSSGRIMMP
jgi:hypothetical protein